LLKNNLYEEINPYSLQCRRLTYSEVECLYHYIGNKNKIIIQIGAKKDKDT